MKKILLAVMACSILAGCHSENKKDFTGVYVCWTKGAKKESDITQKRVLTIYDSGAHALDNNGVHLSLDWANARDDLINSPDRQNVYLQYEKLVDSVSLDYNLTFDKGGNITAMVQSTDISNSANSTLYQMDCEQVSK